MKMSDEDKEAQKDEILALKSIYEENDLLNFDSNSNKGVFYVKIASNQLFQLNFGKFPFFFYY